jgi:reactive intermediate/imine deaminase
VRAGDTVYLSGQLPLDAASAELVDGNAATQIERVLENLSAVAEAAGGSLDNAVRVTVYLTDLGEFGAVNDLMHRYFSEPYPARMAIGVTGLPKGAAVAMDAVLVID